MVTRWWKTLRSPQPKVAGELREILNRERSRADRTRSEFCLICFTTPPAQKTDGALDRFQSLLRTRIRLTDYMGRDSGGELWLVLVDCSAEAARKLLQQAQHDQGNSAALPQHSLFHYPTEPDELHRAALGAAYWNNPGDSDDQPPGNYPNGDSQVAEPKRATADQPMETLFEVATPTWKRALDVVGSGMGLMVAAPLLLIAGLLIKWESKGPVFFAQQRSGRGRRPFTIYKLRSMVVDAEELKAALLNANEQDGPAFKMENDPRITKVGRWLRATCLDELPQLWNILTGDMSFVGPRPLPLSESQGCESWQRHREDATPGLTCFWQVKDRRNKIPFADWARMDLLYIRCCSLVVDLQLLVQTALVVCRRRGI